MPSLKKLLTFKEDEFRAFFSGTPLRRLGYYRFLRNVLIAAANSKQTDLVGEVKKKLDSENELVRAMAIWAISCLDKKQFFIEKKIRFKKEAISSVRNEWMDGEND